MNDLPKENLRSLSFRCLRMTQPIGEFYIGSIKSSDLVEVTFFDVRRRIVEQRDIEKYLGIQRPLSAKRVKELKQYVQTVDACFPTAVILAVPIVCARYEEESGIMTLSNYMDVEDDQEPVHYRNIAQTIGTARAAAVCRNI